MTRLLLKRKRREQFCRCGHSELLHMGVGGKCLAPLGNGRDVPPRRLSDLCCEVEGGCLSLSPSFLPIPMEATKR